MPDTKKKFKILFIIGTRPEAIKLGLLVQKSRSEEKIETTVVSSSQHKEILKETLDYFNITPDYDLDIMTKNQSLSLLTSQLFKKLEPIFLTEKPSLVIAQGDTTTALVASIISFYHSCDFAHVEAGLRSHDLSSPFPEEFNRRVTGILSKFNFAPSDNAIQNLLNEGVPLKSIYLTGNTVIDAVQYCISNKKNISKELERITLSDTKIILVTLHRRENFGTNHKNVLKTINELSGKYPGVKFIISVHPNPRIKDVVFEIFKNNDNVILIEATHLKYDKFIHLVNHAYFIITDSGGIQEEATILKKPVIISRNETERIESIECGGAILIPPMQTAIFIETIHNLIIDEQYYQKFIPKYCPYGDGDAVDKIFKIIRDYYELS